MGRSDTRLCREDLSGLRCSRGRRGGGQGLVGPPLLPNVTLVFFGLEVSCGQSTRRSYATSGRGLVTTSIKIEIKMDKKNKITRPYPSIPGRQ